jgi:hypothetical protein
VAGPAAAVRDDRRGPLHDRLPVRIRHVSDKDLVKRECRQENDAWRDATEGS